MASPSSLTMIPSTLFIETLFLVLVCHAALQPGTLAEDNGSGPVCMRAPQPPSYDSGIVPWDTNYIAAPYSNFASTPDGLHVNLSILSSDRAYGGFCSKNLFLFGYFSMNMKVPPTESAGVVATFYLISWDFDTRDEIDFEFLGNTSGNPITLHTNLYMNGVGDRAQQHILPFDPAADFHKYSVLWNQHLVIWYVDDQVIRVFHNTSTETAVPFPVSRPMQVMCTIWTPNLTDDWVTQGGGVHINYAYAPFVTQYEGFGGVDGCVACLESACDNPDISACSDAGPNNYWFLEQEDLTTTQMRQLKQHRREHVFSDYCNRPEGAPSECPYNTGTCECTCRA